VDLREKIFFLIVLQTSLIFISSCLPWGQKKDEERLYEKGKEGKWVYSEQRPSPYGEEKKAVTYSKKPYGTMEGEGEGAVQPQPIATPYLLGRLKYKVIVLDFQDETKEERKGLGSIVAQELDKQLEESGVVLLVDIELVKKSLEGESLNSLTEPSQLWKVRTFLGVHGIVIGTLKDVLIGTGEKGGGGESLAVTRMEANLIDTETGNIIRSVKGENPIFVSRSIGGFSRDKALLKAINFTLQGIKEGIVRGLSGLEWSTSVASVEGGKVYINAGKSTGLKIGDVLDVYDPGKEIKHPITHISLGRVPGELKGKIKVVQFFGFDASVADIISGGNIVGGNVVKLSKK
jgi:hypothetical protein